MSGAGETHPQVTVGVPVFNGADYLRETLEALQKQELERLEVVISDNGSTDATEDICRSVVASDARFSYHRSPRNRGIPWNYNRVLELASSPYFMWNCHDDIAEPAHLRRCVAELEEHSDAAVAFSRVTLINGEGKAIGELDDAGLDLGAMPAHTRVDRYFARHAYQIIGFGGVIRTSLLRAVGGLPPFYGGDVLLGLRICMSGPLVQVPEQLYRQRRHDQQMNKLQGGDPVEQQLTYAPDRQLKVAFPQWRLNGEMFATTAAAPLSARERMAVGVAVARRWTIPNWRFLPYDLKRNAIRLARGQYRGDYFR